MQAVRGMIDAGSGYPPHWRGEAGSANLATATAMQGPAERHLKRRQRYMVHLLQDIAATAYQRQPHYQPLPTLDHRKLFNTAVPDVSRDDNLQLAQAANHLTQSLTQLIHESEPKSRTLLRTYLEYVFKFMGEPQSGETLDTIIDEMGGFAQGTTKYDVSLDSPVPADGFEVDFFTLARAGQIHELRFVVLKPSGGIAESRLLRGMFMDPGTSIGANKAVDLKVKFRGMEVEAL
jgi:hypothetical protein